MVTISTSNKKIIELLEKNEPFLISRLGIGAETYLTCQYLSGSRINLNYLNALNNNAGIYNVNKTLRNYLDLYSECIKNSDYLACFTSSIINEQNFLINKYNLNILHSRAIEPFYSCLENEKPWSQYLVNKKVLVISPFVESFKKQLNNNFQIFKDPNKKIFLDDQEFIFYKSYQTSAGNHLHNDWFETYNLMKNDITNIDFDIALVSCGGYGLPLCNYIKTTMNKSAMYIGGGLQLLFGVMGKRWESNQMWNNIIRENDTNFIKPSGDEIMKNNNNIEGGCYW